MEYFVFSNSFAAPFFSDSDTQFVEGENALSALTAFVKNYKHPAGLYFAAIWRSADDYHKHFDKPLARWTCNHEIVRAREMAKPDSCSFFSDRPGHFKIDDKWITVADPKEGVYEEIQS